LAVLKKIPGFFLQSCTQNFTESKLGAYLPDTGLQTCQLSALKQILFTHEILLCIKRFVGEVTTAVAVMYMPVSELH
jgi:hypothetical protein